MFLVYRDGSKLKIQIKPNVPGAETWTYDFTLGDYGTDLSAQLIVNAMKDERERILKEIRRESYRRGYSDAKAKRRKQDYFGGWF